MTWLFYAGFCDSIQGQNMAQELAMSGVCVTDLSLIGTSTGQVGASGVLAQAVQNHTRLKPGKPVSQALREVLLDYGMSRGLCESLSQCVAAGGSVLMVTERKRPAPISKLDSLLRQAMPMSAGTFVTVNQAVTTLL